jgi:NhaP-type Na+/H+ or K+/H+ antiporter
LNTNLLSAGFSYLNYRILKRPTAIGFKLIATIDNYQVEVLITLAIVMGSYNLAHYLHLSNPLAMVAAGLVTEN